MYLTHNKGTSVVTERFIKTLKSKIYTRMRANDSKSHLGCLSKLDKYNNTYRSVRKKTY